jgi:hypothetical protein
MANITITAKVRALTTNERAGQLFTHEATFGPSGDNSFSTQTTNADGIIFNILPAANTGYVLTRWAMILDPALSNSADAAFNDCAASFGDAGSATRYISAVQTNINGTEVIYTHGSTPNLYTSDSQIQFLIASMTAKKLSDLNLGKIVLKFSVQGLKGLADAA